jgi:O-antigen/teichoic acid export membrane protein
MSAVDVESVEPDEISEQDHAHHLRRGLKLANVGFVVTMALSLVSSVVTSRLYGAQQFGRFWIAYSPVLLLTQLSSVSEQMGLIRELAEFDPRDPKATGLWRVVFRFSLLVTTAMGLVVGGAFWLYFGRDDDTRDLFPLTALLLATYVVIDNPSWNLEHFLTGFRRATELMLCRIVHAVAQLGMPIVLASVGREVTELVFASIAGSCALLIARLVSVRRLTSLRIADADLKFGGSQLGGILRFGIKNVPASISLALIAPLQIFVLQRFVSETAVGAFGRATNLASRLNEFPFRIGTVLYPTQVRHVADNDEAGLVQSMYDTIRNSFVPIAALVASLIGARSAVLRVFGADFATAENGWVLAITLLGGWMLFLDTVVGVTLLALNRVSQNSIISVVALAVTLALIWPLASRFEAIGVASAFVVCAGLGLVLRLVLLRNAVAGGLDLGHHVGSLLGLGAGILAALVVSWGITHELGQLWTEEPKILPNLIIGGAGGLGGLLAFVGAVRFVGVPEMAFVESILAKFRRTGDAS